ncbi:MAG: VWA domain-containing protein [Chloroflexi bacterium]|nr:VWA domain-containing protein [Chloroflexota bacterium]
MATELIPDEIQFAENPEPRCPCVLLVDVSSSMYGPPMNELNSGIATFAQELKADQLASLRTEVAIVTFGSTAEMVQEFVTADQFQPPTLVANGATMMGAGINLALDKIEERKQMYRDNGIDYYRPWLFLLTDGAPSESQEVVSTASQRLHDAENEKRVAAFSVGVEGANMDLLTDISPRRPLMLKGLEFSSMFVWLSQSMSRVSRSRTDDEITLDTDGLQDWAAI